MPMNPRLLRPRASAALVAVDADARTYINAVRIADGGQYMEAGVQRAIDAFVTGCKSDGIWSSIKASCILAGARTLSGALTPLVGTAPTNNGPFVAGDYNRETGLLGNGTTKDLDTNRNNNADPQDSKHLAVYLSERGANGPIGNPTTASGASWIFNAGPNPSTARINSSASATVGVIPVSGFIGVNRSASAGFDVRYSATTTNYTNASVTPRNENIRLYRASTSYGTNRIAFYSIGESLDLALLDTRVSALITAIGGAI